MSICVHRGRRVGERVPRYRTILPPGHPAPWERRQARLTRELADLEGKVEKAPKAKAGARAGKRK